MGSAEGEKKLYNMVAGMSIVSYKTAFTGGKA